MPAYSRLPLIMLFTAAMISSCKKDATIEQNPDHLSVAPLPNGNYWSQLNVPFFPGPPSSNDRHISFTVNNKIYVVPHDVNQLWQYDPATSQWQSSAGHAFIALILYNGK